MRNGTRTADLVVLVNGFPRLSETFVLHELLDLERRGLRLHVVAVRRPDEAVQQDAIAELQASVEYLPDLGASAPRLAVRVAHAALLADRRARYVNGLASALASPDFSRTTLARSVLLAHRIRRLGAPPVYVHFAHKPATFGRLAALLAGVPFAISAHAKDIWLTPRPELTRKVRDAEVVLTCTAEGHAYVTDLAAGMTPIHLVHHGVETAVPAANPAREPVRVLTVGRLIEKKGHDVLIAAAARARAAGLGFTLRIVGEGADWPRLQRLVHELGLGETVTFLGPLSETETRREYETAQIFALACRQLANGDRDGIPNVVVEAMAHGLPVVSTRLGGISEVVTDRTTGLLCAQDDAAGFAENLATLVRDPDLRRRLGANGRERARSSLNRRLLLPAVFDTLAAAGIVRSETTPGVLGLRAVA